MESLKEIIIEKEPTIIALVETLLEKEDIITIEGYKIQERIDKDENNREMMIAN